MRLLQPEQRLCSLRYHNRRNSWRFRPAASSGTKAEKKTASKVRHVHIIVTKRALSVAHVMQMDQCDHCRAPQPRILHFGRPGTLGSFTIVVLQGFGKHRAEQIKSSTAGNLESSTGPRSQQSRQGKGHNANRAKSSAAGQAVGPLVRPRLHHTADSLVESRDMQEARPKSLP